MIQFFGALGFGALLIIAGLVALGKISALAEKLHKADGETLKVVQFQGELQRQLDQEKRAREDRDSTITTLQGEITRERAARLQHADALKSLMATLATDPHVDLSPAINGVLDELRKLSKAGPTTPA